MMSKLTLKWGLLLFFMTLSIGCLNNISEPTKVIDPHVLISNIEKFSGDTIITFGYLAEPEPISKVSAVYASKEQFIIRYETVMHLLLISDHFSNECVGRYVTLKGKIVKSQYGHAISVIDMTYSPLIPSLLKDDDIIEDSMEKSIFNCLNEI